MHVCPYACDWESGMCMCDSVLCVFIADLSHTAHRRKRYHRWHWANVLVGRGEIRVKGQSLFWHPIRILGFPRSKCEGANSQTCACAQKLPSKDRARIVHMLGGSGICLRWFLLCLQPLFRNQVSMVYGKKGSRMLAQDYAGRVGCRAYTLFAKLGTCFC